MTVRQLCQWWHRVWFEPKPVTPIALYRIFFGLLVLHFGVLLWPDLLNFFGQDAIVSDATARLWWQGPTLNALLLLPHNDSALIAFYVAFMFAAVLLTFGLITRLSAFFVYLALVSFTFRDPFVFHSGDCFIRIAAFLLMLSPCGEALSLDNLVRVAFSKDPVGIGRALSPPWAQRLLQFNLAAVYADAFWTKAVSEQWVSGMAVYYASRLEQFKRLPVPFLFDSILMCKLLTWSTLVLELMMWTLIWFRDLRYFLLGAAIVFHLALDWAMNIPLFQWTMITAFILFVDPADLTALMNVLKRRVRKLSGDPIQVCFDGATVTGQRTAELIRRVDVFGLIELADRHAVSGSDAITTQSPDALLAVRAGNRWIQGFEVWRSLAGRLPILWIVYPAIMMPGAAWLANRLDKQSGALEGTV